MIMHSILLLALSLAPLLAQSLDVPQAARVKVIVVNSFGGAVREVANVRIAGLGGSQTVSVRQRAIIHLSPGTYTAECSAASYTKQFRTVMVRDPETLVVFGLAMKAPDQLVGEGPITPWVLSGQLDPAPQNGSVLVNVVGVFTGISSEVEADERGRFSVNVFDQGKYYLFVLADGQIVKQREVNIDISVPKTFKLGTLLTK
jgi:hypothetical protein